MSLTQTLQNDFLDEDFDFLNKLSEPKYQTSILSSRKAKRHIRTELKNFEKMINQNFTQYYP